MSITLPNESPAYRDKRNELLAAERALRDQIEAVARLRRALPPGGEAANYTFDGRDGPVTLDALFGDKETLILYSYMFGPDSSPCPMCSGFMDSLKGQIQHVTARVAFAVTARSSMDRISRLVDARGWDKLAWVSCANNTYPIDYKSEMPDGSQVPMCSVFQKRAGKIHHFWTSELFFAPSDYHPRHVDMLWPLWHIFDITPEGRGEFFPQLDYSDR